MRRILRENADTTFGQRYRFDKIADVATYREAVPVHTYEDLRPLVEEQAQTGMPALTTEPPVFYNRTSGTLGAPKDIPLTRSGIKRIRQSQLLSAFSHAAQSKIFSGKVFGVTGQAVEGRMTSGAPFGSASGLIYKNQSRFVRARYVLPAELADLSDCDVRYLSYAIFAASEPHVSCMATANPSTLVRIMDVVNRQADTVLGALADGRLPPAVRACAAEPRLPQADRIRARALERLLGSKGKLDVYDLWPGLKGFVTWTGGSCGFPLRSLAPSLPKDCQIVELGYIASEVYGAVNIDLRRNVCLPTFTNNFFEFVERDAWEKGRPTFLGLHELSAPAEYYLFMTTPDGLYRYDMNDIVRITGHIGETPTIEFVQKGKGVTNITGEKLYEAQVLSAVSESCSALGLDIPFFVVIADEEESRYRLYCELNPPGSSQPGELPRCLDDQLQRNNLEYQAKRGSGRLKPLSVRRLKPGTGESFRRERVAKGQRDAQFKHLHLQYARDCEFDFNAHAWS